LSRWFPTGIVTAEYSDNSATAGLITDSHAAAACFRRSTVFAGSMESRSNARHARVCAVTDSRQMIAAPANPRDNRLVLGGTGAVCFRGELLFTAPRPASATGD